MKKFKVTVDGHTYTVEVEELAEETKASGGVEKTEAKSLAAEPVSATTEVSAPAHKQQEEPDGVSAGGGLKVKAPMPGSVLDVKVSAGDKVSEGDVLLILEAMKMENELTAAQAGTIAEVLVKKGDTVNSGDPLIIMS